MALISIIDGFLPRNDPRLLARAEQLKPTLYYDTAAAAGLPTGPLGRGDELCLDFGRHLVGSLTLSLSFSGSHPDAPAFLRLRFAETRYELEADAEAFDGWLSRSWIQEETVHLDEVPGTLTLPRRYAFRYLRITVLDSSPKYRLVVENAVCRTVTAAELGRLRPLESGDPLLDRIYEVSLRTLADCMQEVFEDGPKRDRRMWTGDLRLEALTNAVSFRNFDLVKRCLYLFGGSRFPDGRVSANLFTRPEPAADDTFLLDYALGYASTLEEYLAETGDEEALKDLYGIAMEQLEYGLAQCGPNGVVSAEAAKACFIDWNDALDRQACAQGVLICALEDGVKLARRRGDPELAARFTERLAALRAAALAGFWDGERGLFVSNGQISAASQIWMVLAGVPAPGQAAAVMRAVRALGLEAEMGTPYLHHYYTMALLKAGLRAEAVAHVKDYWGGMLAAGADTFWECWDGIDPTRSPYGGCLVNSYCHAWSCTPAWIIERYLK